ncbi:universal stress protein [Actinomycetospora straminea]|uniref:UspA domain-containing protein n=1 Tax=Actinomycetospora straminea TaxID=663607 RepID=A0ABP9EM28_9PSEU|nr:universal stress protein [Actinomycetospora straminea]MDD7933215.1 universal stress protein [Actinomycetospora straminea]
MRDPAPAPVVVGVDDGLLRVRVLDRAVREARGRGGPLVLVHTHGPETPLAPWYDDAGRRAEAYLTRTAPDLAVELLCRAGDITDTLVGACAAGSVLVLGDRHRRLGTEAGHTTERVIVAAPCPVLVIPEYRGPTPRGAVERRAVVVGVDDGGSAPAVLAYAVRTAADLGVPLEVVRAVPPPEDAEGAGEVADADLAAARRALDRLVAALRPGPVPVRTEVVVDRPARALLGRAAGADEVVVGHRRDGAASLRGPGSTARSVLAGAPCAVAVLGPRGLDQAATAVTATEGTR